MKLSDLRLNGTIDAIRKKQGKKPLKGPGSKLIRQFLRRQLRESIRKNNRRRAA